MFHMIHPRMRAAALGCAMAGVAMCAHVRQAHADTVYKCGGSDGAATFQQEPCANAKAQAVVEIAPAPPASASPDYGIARDAHKERREPASSRNHARAPREALSYECRAANGEVFYRHGACPRQITGEGNGSRGRSSRSTYAVSAEALPRGEACRRMASAGSIGRSGHERDETVSTYDRNLGRDPCRYF